VKEYTVVEAARSQFLRATFILTKAALKPSGQCGRQGGWWSQWRNQPTYRRGKEAKMNRVSKLSRAVAVVAAFAAAPTHATQPGQTMNPNGFPEGAHKNLNILGIND
jgi:hypothetical protein